MISNYVWYRSISLLKGVTHQTTLHFDYRKTYADVVAQNWVTVLANLKHAYTIQFHFFLK